MNSRLRLVLVPGLLLLALAAGPSLAAAESLPGGRRPLSFTLNGEWIGLGISFSPFRDGQGPDGQPLPSEEEIAEDLRLVVRYWKLIRMYDSSLVSERTLRIIHRERLPMRVILGVWLMPERNEDAREKNAAQVAAAIRLANAYPGEVLAVSVGNEAMVDWSGHRMEPSDVIASIRAVRAAIRQPVATADDCNFWNLEVSKTVSAEVDFIILHAYALWQSQPLDGAMAWTAARYEEARRFHPGVPIVIGETGWATENDPTRTGPGEEASKMKAEASVAAQENYLRQHYRWVREQRVPTFLFEAFDETWKGGGAKVSPKAAEKHWGVFDTQRRPKPSFSAIIRDFYPEAK